MPFGNLPHCRLLYLASRSSMSAAGVKVTSMRRIDGTGYVALKDNPLSFDRGVGDWNGREQGLGIWVCRPCIERLLWSHLYELAQVHNGNAIADVFDNRQVVRDEQIA